MPLLTSEAVILRTWPVREADLVVSFFTRDYGRLHGLAKHALRSRKRFGGALEPTTLVRAWFRPQPRQDFVRLDQLEILRSPLSAPVDLARMAVLSCYAELMDEALPEHDPQDAVFRLALAVFNETRAATSESSQPWMALTYFLLWMTRLLGLLPEMSRCTLCGQPLPPGGAAFSPTRDGCFCSRHAQPDSTPLSADSWELAQRILRSPLHSLATEPWPRKRAQDLRRFALQTLERHLERKLKSAETIARLGA